MLAALTRSGASLWMRCRPSSPWWSPPSCSTVLIRMLRGTMPTRVAPNGSVTRRRFVTATGTTAGRRHPRHRRSASSISAGYRAATAARAAFHLPHRPSPAAAHPRRRVVHGRRALADHHAERRLLPHRHRAADSRDRPVDLEAEDHRHGRERGRAHLRRAARPAARREHDDPHLRLERGRRKPDQQRDLARLPHPAPARPGEADAERRHGALAQPGRLDGRARRSRR